jgi:hypothetical protein
MTSVLRRQLESPCCASASHPLGRLTDLQVHRPTPTTTEVLRSIGELYVIEAEIGVSDRSCANGLGRSAHGHCSTVSNAGCENG